MDIYTAFSSVNKAVLDVIHSLNFLQPVKNVEKPKYVRLEETPFILTEEISTTCQIITAHDLHQYRNKYYKIKLQDDVRSWRQQLMQARLKVEE